MDGVSASLVMTGRSNVGRMVRVSSSDSEFIDVLRNELPRIQRVARLLTGDADAADDLVAEAIVRTLPHWRAGGIDDHAAYLRRVVVNLATRRWKRRALSARRDHLALAWMPQPADAPTAHAERDGILRAVMRLPVRRRAVVVLRFYDDMTEARVAEVLGVTAGTVKSQLSKALKQLRSDLESLDQV